MPERPDGKLDTVDVSVMPGNGHVTLYVGEQPAVVFSLEQARDLAALLQSCVMQSRPMTPPRMTNIRREQC